MDNDLEDLNYLEYCLEYSGFILNMITQQYGGDAWIKSIYNISNERFFSFVKKARELNIIEKIDMDFKYKTVDINDELLYWIGNKRIVEYISYDIRHILKSGKYVLYLCNISSTRHVLSEFTDIFDLTAMEGLLFLFKSKEKTITIALHWTT